MDDSLIYSFSQGNRLEERNTYFYIPFQGANFLNAWRGSRENILSQLGGAEPFQIKKSGYDIELSEPIITEHLLVNIYNSLDTKHLNVDSHATLNKLVQRFEVSKRIHVTYPENFRPNANISFNNLYLYVVFAQVLERAYQKLGKLYYLNALIKIIDTLCSMTNDLLDKEKKALAWLIINEYKHVKNVSISQKVSI